MTDLVVCLGDSKGTREHVKRLIQGEEWDTVFVVKPKETASLEISNKKIVDVNVDMSKAMPEVESQIRAAIKPNGIDLGLNIVSGDGKLHMATMAAVLKLGFGIRFIAYTLDGVKEL